MRSSRQQPNCLIQVAELVEVLRTIIITLQVALVVTVIVLDRRISLLRGPAQRVSSAPTLLVNLPSTMPGTRTLTEAATTTGAMRRGQTVTLITAMRAPATVTRT